MTEIDELWKVVDTLTKPARKRIERADREDELASELLDNLANSPTRRVCHIVEYRRAVARMTQQSDQYGTVPCLWDQAEAAVINAGEQTGSGASPLRERSPADIDLMETLYTIRDAITDQIELHHQAPRQRTPDRIRQFASLLVRDKDDEQLARWSTKLARWVRELTARLDAADAQPKPVRIRDTPCPACGTRQVRVFEQDEWRLVPPLRIDFRDGQVRAATCGQCGSTWFRGDGLNHLADTLGRSAIVA